MDHFEPDRPSGAEIGELRDDLRRDVERIAESETVPTILETVSLATAMRFAAVVRVTENRWIACQAVDDMNTGLGPGDELDLDKTLCQKVRALDRELVVPDVRADPEYRDHPAPARHDFRSYVAVPVRREDGSFFGTLCAFDGEPRDVDDPRVLAMFRLFAQTIGSNLATEEKLQVSEARLAHAQDVAKLREEFVAILGHDLRNPLAAIQAGLRMLSRQSLSEEGAEIVTQIRASALRMAGLVENVLDHARVRLGSGIGIGVRMRETDDLGQTLHQVVTEIRAVSPEREFEEEIAVPGAVTCDPGRLEQLLSNLLANAVVHGDPEEPVSVRAGLEAGELVIEVGNGGAPIPPETQARIFEPLAQAGGEASSGLGLGLHIARLIAEGHGGQLDLVSETDRIAFVFRMPANPA